jgi:hypothetical protein
MKKSATEVRLPPSTLHALNKLQNEVLLAASLAREAAANASTVQARYQHLLAVIERDHGFRFTETTTIGPDGIVIIDSKAAIETDLKATP